MKIFYIIVLFSLLFAGCKKKEVGPQRVDGSPYYKEKGSKVVIGCEGNYGWGNASISVYNTKTNEVTNNVFQSQNNLPLGDVMQSSTLFDGKLFLVVNNSNKIEVVDTADFKRVGQITGLTSPRYFCGVSASKAYVTDLYANAITIINPTTYQTIGTISVGAWTEEMLYYNNQLFVTEKGTDKVLVIDITTDQITDTITVGREPNSIVLDKNNKIWVLCSGGINESLPKLHRINSATYSVEQTFTFSSINESPNSLRMDSSRTHLLYINNNIYKMNTSATTLPTSAFINNGNSIFYGLGVSPYTNKVYVADAIDYVQAGKVYQYNFSGNRIQELNVGIIPQDFTFIEEN